VSEVTPVTPPRAHEGPVTEPIVRLEYLVKRFLVRRSWAEMFRRPFLREYNTAVGPLSLAVKRGEFFGLLGLNGAGKTTLFKMLATLLIPDEGRASVGGYDAEKDAAAVRSILTPVIADERSLLWRLSALENLKLYAGLYGIRGPLALERAAETLEIVGLSDTGEKMVGSFSSGMKQRLLIGRALLGRPRVLLLDEPTRSLDPVSARKFRRFLREEILGRQGCTVLLATHNADEALELCDRVAVLHHGQLLALGTVAELSKRIGDERYRVRTGVDAATALDRLAEAGMICEIKEAPVRADGWAEFEFEIPGGPDAASEVVALLVRSKHPIARFERIELSLADLLERIVGGGTLRA
jgi:ABC-2 type transport system ATP-binding protein